MTILMGPLGYFSLVITGVIKARIYRFVCGMMQVKRSIAAYKIKMKW